MSAAPSYTFFALLITSSRKINDHACRMGCTSRGTTWSSQTNGFQRESLFVAMHAARHDCTWRVTSLLTHSAATACTYPIRRRRGSIGCKRSYSLLGFHREDWWATKCTNAKP
ncbi:unnamed protein product [Periconia digitata]|uniref:Uncharacterized protein n=1 Tax=Periconia digitata TaxID=1303443 RepID=A0A9W4U7T6_9PLEO|nr:unnamed protein product [Periconia digitata]